MVLNEDNEENKFWYMNAIYIKDLFYFFWFSPKKRTKKNPTKTSKQNKQQRIYQQMSI